MYGGSASCNKVHNTETEGLNIRTETRGLDTKGAIPVEAACCSYQMRWQARGYDYSLTICSFCLNENPLSKNSPAYS